MNYQSKELKCFLLNDCLVFIVSWANLFNVATGFGLLDDFSMKITLSGVKAFLYTSTLRKGSDQPERMRRNQVDNWHSEDLPEL